MAVEPKVEEDEDEDMGYGTPANNQKCGCCWLCSAKPENWKALSVEERKSMSLQQADWLSSLENRGKQTNPLFQLPGVTNWSLFPDWMHVADEGDAALAAGQILHELLPSYAAPNQEARVRLLWDHIQSIYEARDWPAQQRLPKLTLKDIKKPGRAAELDVKAAQCRHFAPVVAILTEENGFRIGSPRHKAIHNAARYCAKMYAALEAGDSMAIASNGYKFVSQYLALEEHAVTWDPDDTKTWRARPKFHLLQHILDEACKGLHPKDVWNYRDETFGYTMQQLWFRRGGKTKSPKVESESVLLRWAKAQRPGACKRLWKQSLKKLTGKPERGLMYESQ